MSTEDNPPIENGAPPNSVNSTNVRMSECLPNGNNGTTNNPFTTQDSSALENGQFDVGNENGKYNRFGFSANHNYNVSRRKEVVAKVKEAANRHCNEYRIAVLILVILIIIGFSVLVRMNKNIISYQDQKAIGVVRINGVSRKICNGSPRCCSETNKCGEMEGDCNSDFDCLDGLRCGNENCNENSGNWVPGADCCYKPKHIDTISSSVFENDTSRFGSHFAIDGTISRTVKGVFHSELEDYPWIQWELPRRVNMLGISLTTRSDCCGERLRDVQIRAGKNPVDKDYRGIIRINSLCGKFAGPGETARDHSVICDKPIIADYVTIQILDDRAILALNEIRIETVSHDKTSGCKGGDSCCTSSIPCGEWEGDCDSDEECQDGLVCGHNNCPLKPQGYWAAGKWDATDDCCYRKRNETGSAKSSSINDDDDDRWGPKNAIDGLWSDSDGFLFQSKKENMPWIQWHLPKTTQMIGIMISSRNRLSAGQLKHLEVRAGTSFVEDNFTGKMRINELCGSFDGPGKNRRVYTIMCKNEIEADYVSLQILDLDSVLEINELEIIPKSQEKDVGCSCHEYVNQNGYGQCQKKDFHQEHVKLLHVCYVNQPSNCSDLYASVTDPGKKLSAEACPIGDAEEDTTVSENTDSYECYHYTVDEDEMIDSEAKNKEVCESHPGFIFTKGDASKAPGCTSGCWCCKPI